MKYRQSWIITGNKSYISYISYIQCAEFSNKHIEITHIRTENATPSIPHRTYRTVHTAPCIPHGIYRTIYTARYMPHLTLTPPINNTLIYLSEKKFNL